jgi:hypothetical protein
MSSSAEFAAQVALIRKRIDPDVLAAIREAHDALDFGCSAHGEGLACCMDWLLSDDGPELHQISAVAAYEMRQG